MFKVPDSTPPSTPDSHRYSRNQPSTTPAGPPPSNYSHKSFTPAGPPPSSVFGSSQAGTANSRIAAPNFGSAKTNVFKQSGLRGFTAPGSSPPPQEIEEDDIDMENEVADEEAMDQDDDFRSPQAAVRSGRGLRSSQMSLSAKSPRRSRLSQSVAETVDLEQTAIIGELDGVAKGIAVDLSEPALNESNQIIIETDRQVRRLYEDTSLPIGPLAADVVASLRDLWTSSIDSSDYTRSNTIGPSNKSPGLVKASFVSNLMLELHHPQFKDSKQKLTTSRFGRSSLGSSTAASRNATALPKVLLDWLNREHDPADADLQEVLREPRGYSASGFFWDVVFSSLFRGKFSQAIRLLRGANWSVADCAREDGYEDPGYQGRELQQTEIAVERVIKLLENCPAVRSDDWNVAGSDWTIWRHSVRQAIDDLENHANGGKDDDLFNEGARSSTFGISTSSRRGENRLPSMIYESLSEMLNSLLGNPLEVIKSACDWVEAVVGMTVWWDGEDEAMPTGSLAMSRRSLQRSQQSRSVDVSPSHAYLQRLRWAVGWVLEAEEDQLQVNTTNAVEVALACAFAGQIEHVLDIVERWSLPVASSTAEIASAGRWLAPKAASRSLIRTFDQSDLMVLGHDQDQSSTSTKDRILIAYAGRLAERESIEFDVNTRDLKGWNMAVQVLGRLNDEQLASEKIGEIFDTLPLESEQDVEGMIALCDDLGLGSQVKKIAERYAEHLSANTTLYGPALLYYARAQNATKLRDVLDLLVSHCLVTSRSYPPLNECDPTLRRLIKAPKSALGEMESVDPEAARLLSIYLSGYATLRRFYDLRDGDEKARLGLDAKKQDSINALVVVIESANDSIKGGLYDQSVEVVVQVDGLLVLLGETLPFLNQSSHYLSLQQSFTLLKAVEDLQTVASRIYDQCEAFLQAALNNQHDGSLPQNLSPSKQRMQQSRTLGRSQSSGLTGSQYSLLDGSATSSQEIASVSSGSEVMVRKQAPTTSQGDAGRARGWDWRAGFPRGTKGKDVLSVLRLALAKEVADGWLDEDA